jgi:uncharacterized protein YjiS (DUF1127 family)
MREVAMFDVNRDNADGSSVLKDLGDEFLELLAPIGDRLSLGKAFRWLRDQALRHATSRELYLLSDYYLEDIGIGRCNFDLKTDDLVKRLRAGG